MKILNFGSLNIDKVYSVPHFVEAGETLSSTKMEVFSGGNQYAGDTDTYLRLLARVNRALAARADEVCEVVCGLPVWYKSENEVFV